MVRAAGEKGIDYGEWREQLDAEGGWTKKVLIQAENSNDMLSIFRAVNGKMVKMGARGIALEATSTMQDLPHRDRTE